MAGRVENKVALITGGGSGIDTLTIALHSSGLERVRVQQRPRLPSDNGPSYLSTQLGSWLVEHGMTHTRGKPYHPMTQGKIER